MKLRTSFFNKTVLKKDITRFAPVWGLYTVFMLLYLFLLWSGEDNAARFANSASQIMPYMGVVNLIYGGIAAQMLFGDLFQSKMAGALHAMPLRREGWFLTHFTAGMLFSIVPNTLGAILACAILQEYCYLAFVWLLVMLLQYLFSFGVGVFSVQCAGNRLGALAIYGLFNFLAVLAAFLVDTFYAPVLYGIEPDVEKICRYAPAVGFSMSEYMDVDYDNMTRVAQVQMVGEDFRYLLLASLVGIVLLAAAVVLYRRRPIECAGDFVAVKPVAPAFLVIYTLCVGAVLYLFADLVAADGEYLFLLVGFAVGFFTGWMLLEKKVNVFQGKKWLGLGIFTAVFFLTVTILWLDPVGVTRYVPEASQVQSVDVSPYASRYYLDKKALNLTEQEDIEEILSIHSDLVQTRPQDGNELCVRLRYHLRGGGQVERQYFISAENENAKRLRIYFSDFRLVTQLENPEALMEKVYAVSFRSYTDNLPDMEICTPAEKEEWGNKERFESGDCIYVNSLDTAVFRDLVAAIQADCASGAMAQQWEFHGGKEAEGMLEIRYMYGPHVEYLDITVFDDCENTVNYLKTLAGKS